MKDEFRIPIEEKSQHLLALIHTNKAIVLRSRGDVSGAVKLYDKALDIRERQVFKEGKNDFAHFLAVIYMNKAMAEERLGDACKALILTDKAISIWKSLRLNGNDQSLYFLSRVLSNKALLVERLGNSIIAVSLLEQSIDNYRHLINKEGRNDLMTEFATLEHHLKRLRCNLP